MGKLFTEVMFDNTYASYSGLDSFINGIEAQLKNAENFSASSLLNNIEKQLKDIKRLPTLLERSVMEQFPIERYQRLINEVNISLVLLETQYRKLVQSNLIYDWFSKNPFSPIESQIKNSRKKPYYSYYSGTNKNYAQSQRKSSTQSNDSQNREQNYSQAASKSQSKEQNASHVTNSPQQITVPNNKGLRCNATLQFEILVEINSHTILNNNNFVEWSPSKWFGNSGKGRRISNSKQASYNNSLKKLIKKGLVRQEKPARPFYGSTGNAPTYFSLTIEGYSVLEQLRKNDEHC